jgi:hypothetical protein
MAGRIGQRSRDEAPAKCAVAQSAANALGLNLCGSLRGL